MQKIENYPKQQKHYNFFGQFPKEYKEKIQFISKQTYLPKICLFKKLIDTEFNTLKRQGNKAGY